MFEKILNKFKKELSKRVFQRDISNFLNKYSKTILDVVTKKYDKRLKQTTILIKDKYPFLNSIELVLPTQNIYNKDKKLFNNNDLPTQVTIEHYDEIKAKITFTRKSEVLIKKIFLEIFEQLCRDIKQRYIIKKVSITSTKNKLIKIFLTYTTRPTDYFQSILFKRITQEVGNVKLILLKAKKR